MHIFEKGFLEIWTNPWWKHKQNKNQFHLGTEKVKNGFNVKTGGIQDHSKSLQATDCCIWGTQYHNSWENRQSALFCCRCGRLGRHLLQENRITFWKKNSFPIILSNKSYQAIVINHQDPGGRWHTSRAS